MGEVPLSPERAEGPRGNNLPAYVANGVVGLRVREIAVLPGTSIVNGVVGLHQEQPVEAAICVPYPLAADVGIGEGWLSEQPWSTSDLEQRYDFGTGELFSSFVFHVDDVAVRTEVVTFASRNDPALVLQQVRLVSDRPCTIRVRAMVATSNARGRTAEREVGKSAQPADGALLWIPEGELSSCGIACYSRCVTPKSEAELRHRHGSGALTTEYRIALKPGKGARLEQITALVPSVSHRRPKQEAIRRLAAGIKLGFEKLRAHNRESWSSLWMGRIKVDGASTEHQRLIDAGFFYLNSSAHLSSPSATSMFGLANWPDYDHYYGQVMWDVDAFCVPPLLLLQPGAGQSMLDFRAAHIDTARAYAKLDGHKGLRFPWQAAPLSGEEACPDAGDAATNAAHVSLHVARAFALHADVTCNNR